MTVASSVAKSGPYAGAGTTGPFTVGFRFLDNSHLRVVKTDINGADSTLALNIDYTVTGVGLLSGTVTLAAALGIGEKLTIIRSVPFTQEADYVQNDAFPAESHETALDKGTMIDQQLQEQIDRSIKIGVSDTPLPPLAGPAGRSNQIIGFDALGNLILYPVTASIGAGDRVGFTLVNGVDFTAGVSTTIALPRAPGVQGNLELFFDPIFQGFDQWTVNDTTVTFTAPIPVGVTKIFGYIGTTLSMEIPPDGSVDDTKVAPGSKQENRNLDLYLVRDFGTIDPTGVIDSAAAFQAAANSGKSILIPPGVYRLNSTITITLSGTRFIGSGRGATELRTYSVGHAIAVNSGLNSCEFYDLKLTRNGVPVGVSQNGLHFSGIHERARVIRVDSEGHWYNFRLCATSLSWTDHLFSDNAYGNGIYQTNEDAVAAGMQWEHTAPFFQRSNGRGLLVSSSFGTTANIGPIFGAWSFANKLGGLGFFGQALHPLNGVRLIGGFSGEEGSDSIYVDTYGTVDVQIADFQTEINGTTSVGVNNTTPATNTGRGITITANNTNAFLNNCTALGHSFSGIVTSCPRIVMSGNTVRANGAAAIGGERNGIHLAGGRATCVGNSSLGQLFGIFFENDNHVIVGNDVSEGNGTPIGGALTPTVSQIQLNLGSTVYSPQDAGWTAGTGTSEKGTFAAYTGGTASGSYSQVDMQAVMNALVNTSRRVLALERAIRLVGIIN